MRWSSWWSLEAAAPASADVEIMSCSLSSVLQLLCHDPTDWELDVRWRRKLFCLCGLSVEAPLSSHTCHAAIRACSHSASRQTAPKGATSSNAPDQFQYSYNAVVFTTFVFSYVSIFSESCIHATCSLASFNLSPSNFQGLFIYFHVQLRAKELSASARHIYQERLRDSIHFVPEKDFHIKNEIAAVLKLKDHWSLEIEMPF